MEFNPDLTPQQMEALGVLSGIYNDKDPKAGNFFGVEASMKQWKEKWLHESAPMGWYEWYQGYASGKRGPDDERQMRRWYLFKARHLGQLAKADPGLTDLSVQPRRRQALLNWGIAPGIDVEKALRDKTVNKYLEKAAELSSRDTSEKVGLVNKVVITGVSGVAANRVIDRGLLSLTGSLLRKTPTPGVTEKDVASYVNKNKLHKVIRQTTSDGYNVPPYKSNKLKGVVNAISPDIALHEYGHARSFKEYRKGPFKKKGYALGRARMVVKNLDRYGGAGFLTASMASADDSKVRKAAPYVAAALYAPILHEEARATLHPYMHLRKTRGSNVANQFLRRMLPAYGTYTAAPIAALGAAAIASKLRDGAIDRERIKSKNEKPIS